MEAKKRIDPVGNNTGTKEKETLFMKFLRGVEVVGNKLPQPFWMFLGLWGAVIILSFFMSGVSAISPKDHKPVVVQSLLSQNGIAWTLKNLVKNYAEFPPLGLVVVMMIGLGVTNKSGLLEDSMKKLTIIPRKYLIFAIFVIGICGNLASSAGTILIPTLTASLFFSMKKNPIFGLCLGFVAISSGYAATLFIGGTDVLLAGITTSAYQAVVPKGTVSPACNYYFAIASVVVVSIVGAWYTEKFLMPKFGAWDERFESCEAAIEEKNAAGNKQKDNKVALKWARWFTILYWAAMILMVAIPGGPLRDAKKNTIIPSPFIDGIVPLLLVYFILVGVIYGRKTGVFKTSKDIITAMQGGVRGVVSLMVLILPIANFIAAFQYSNISAWLAIKMANGLMSAKLTGIGLIIGIILITCVVNLFITSGSTKWALLAPIFVPVMSYLGFSPAFTQLLYRVGDASTLTITPLHPYIPVFLGVAQKYDKEVGIGSIFCRTLPLAIVFLITWTILVCIWYVFNLPLGPGSFIRM